MRLLACAVALACAWGGVAQAQSDEGSRSGQWFIGGYYRHTWIPTYMLDPFVTRAPSITNDGGGLVGSYRSAGGFTVQFGLGYMPYELQGAFTADDTPIEDTEYVTSDLALVHATGSLLWPIELHRMLGLELGFGLDLGWFAGDLTRTEAYPDAAGNFQPCQSAHNPTVFGPNRNNAGMFIEYCAEALDANGNPIATNTASQKGEQYGVRDDSVPPVMAFPMLPHLTLRFAPHEQVAIKLEFAFGIAQIAAGASVHVGFGTTETPRDDEIMADVRPEREPEPEPEPVVAPPAEGRVLGKLMDKASKQPIVGAAVKSRRMMSVLQTDERGYFIVDDLAPGKVRFEFTHDDYEAGGCETTIPKAGGDVPLHCFLVARPTTGAISGQVKDDTGAPVAGARVAIMGPVGSDIVTSAEGLFALPDAPEGGYRIRVDAEGFLMQLLDVHVAVRETALPQVILTRKPATSLVTVKSTEIYIKQQINFETNSAEIGSSSDALMREIADALLRNEDIEQVEIQGHTDNKGGRAHNQELSQARAESVRSWLVRAGVAESRLSARGYGQDRPLRPNSTAADRAKNRRVQFIILKQTR